MEEARRLLSLRVRGRELDPVRAVAAFCIAAVVVIVAARAVPAVRDLDREAAELSALTQGQRSLLGARTVDMDTRVFVLARDVMPRDAVYYVATGPKVGVTNSATLPSVGPFARYYLLPRRQTLEPTQAGWILSYGGDLDALGLRYARRIDVAPGIELAEVAR